MEYVVIVDIEAMRCVFVPDDGRPWLDRDTAQAWGEQYLKKHLSTELGQPHSGSFEVVVLNYAV